MKLTTLISIIHQYDETGYDALSQAIPNLKNVRFGPQGGDGEEQKADFTLEEAIQIAMKGLKHLEPMIKPGLDKVKSKMRWSKALTLIGELIAAVSSAGVITAIWGTPPDDPGNPIAIGLACVALLTNFATIGSRYLLRDLNGNDKGLIQSFKALSEGGWESQTLIAKLEVIQAKVSPKGKDTEQLVNRAEQLARELCLVLDKI